MGLFLENGSDDFSDDWHQVTIQLMDEEWQISLFIQPRQVISDEAVGRVRYYLGEAE